MLNRPAFKLGSQKGSSPDSRPQRCRHKSGMPCTGRPLYTGMLHRVRRLSTARHFTAVQRPRERPQPRLRFASPRPFSCAFLYRRQAGRRPTRREIADKRRLGCTGRAGVGAGGPTRNLARRSAEADFDSCSGTSDEAARRCPAAACREHCAGKVAGHAYMALHEERLNTQGSVQTTLWERGGDAGTRWKGDSAQMA